MIIVNKQKGMEMPDKKQYADNQVAFNLFG